MENPVKVGDLGVPLPPVIIHFNGIFPYKPTILGYPHGLETSKSSHKLGDTWVRSLTINHY